MSDESAWRAINRAHWDEKVGIHLGPRGYDLTALREGRARFYPFEEAELGPVAGKRVLHLQCHFRFRHPEIRSTRRQCRRLGFFRGCDRRCPAIGR